MSRKAERHDERDYAVVLDKPGARLEGATVRGRVLVKADGCTVSGIEIQRPDTVRALVVPAAFVVGAVLGGLVGRWGR